ncbi:MAG: site-2 protease family protein [Clostridia bacterium]|nr:site-2 protease family protein [Clostridia bacterium]
MNIPLKKTVLKVHPLFPALFLFSFFTGKQSVLFTLLALLLHESGHLLVLRLFHMQPSQISLTPFGGLIELPENGKNAFPAAFFTAAAGPLFSLLGFILSPYLFKWQILSFSSAFSFMHANLLLLLFNLLPVLPLDGGRMLQAILSRFFRRKPVSNALLILGNVIALSLIGLSVYGAVQGQYQFAPAFAGLYVLYGCGMENRCSAYHYYTSLISRRSRPLAHPLPVQQLAVSAKTPLENMLPRLKANHYHQFSVLHDDGMAQLGSLNEAEYCALLMENSFLTFADALHHINKQRSK